MEGREAEHAAVMDDMRLAQSEAARRECDAARQRSERRRAGEAAAPSRRRRRSGAAATPATTCDAWADAWLDRWMRACDDDPPATDVCDDATLMRVLCVAREPECQPSAAFVRIW